VAQGSVAIAGFQAEGAAASLTRGVPTVGRISNGALIEQEIDYQFKDTRTVRLALRNPDLTTGRRIALAINEFMAANAAEPTDPSTVNLAIPKNFKGNMVQLLTEIEQLRVDPDQVARVVIDERTGVIVMGKDVRVSTVAIAQGNLTISITEQPLVSQPGPFSGDQAQTVVVPRTTIQVDQGQNNKLAVLKDSVTLKELVDGLNALGIGPRDIISILQAIKAAGALQAEIEVM
jgi:flagellar P-ring protein precursor FlgI